jgi:hypothetical protein
MGNVKGRVFYTMVGLAAITAGVAPWALGLGRPASAVGVSAAPALAPAASAELATATTGLWSTSGHAAMLGRVGAMAGGDSGKAVPAQPALYLSCGATRDDRTKWIVIPSGNEPCPGITALSYTKNTSPSNVRHAIWWPELTGGFSAPKGNYTVKAWIPSEHADALVEYDARYCGQSNWQPIGTINQATSKGWAPVSGKLYVDPSEAVCQIREENTGPGVADMTEDAIEILAN